jgi:vacuolar-type H+-ATPase subunit E/Vma4
MNVTDRERMLDHLRQQGEAQIQGLWQRAREQIRLEAEAMEQQLATARQLAEARNSRQAEEFVQLTLLAAKKKAGVMRITAQDTFAQRLWSRAMTLLPQLLESAGEELLARLRQELPPINWTKVTIHPRDHEQAQALFPRAEIVDDPSLQGGFMVAAEEGKIRIVNTLTKRLAILWPEQLPKIMADLRKEQP